MFVKYFVFYAGLKNCSHKDWLWALFGDYRVIITCHIWDYHHGMTSHHVCICNIKKKQLTVCFHIFILCLKRERFIIYAVLLSLLLSIVFLLLLLLRITAPNLRVSQTAGWTLSCLCPPVVFDHNVLPVNSRIQAGWWAGCHQQPLHLKTDFTYKTWVIYLRICTISSLLVPPCTETQMLFSDFYFREPYTCTHGTHSQITFHFKICNRGEDTYANVMCILRIWVFMWFILFAIYMQQRPMLHVSQLHSH